MAPPIRQAPVRALCLLVIVLVGVCGRASAEFPADGKQSGPTRPGADPARLKQPAWPDSSPASLAPVVVDYRADNERLRPSSGRRPTGKTAMRGERQAPGPEPRRGPEPRIGSGECTFDIECEDGDPCTDDFCNIDLAKGLGSGTCVHDPVSPGWPGECDDGVFCDGREVCNAAGQCVPGTPATCCSAGVATQYCTEILGRCDETSPVPGKRCSNDAECGSGSKCNHCIYACTTNVDCNDGSACNGAEICSAGQCQPGPPLCGPGAQCSEKSCVGQTPSRACTSDENCNPGFTCGAPAVCFLGRCCTNQTEPVCSSRRIFGQANGCAAGSRWYPGDAGFETGAVNTCGGQSPYNPGVALGCPKYSSGIEQLSATAVPAHPVAVGPVSNSPVSISPPRGPGQPFYRIGDDYTLGNGSPIALSAIRLLMGSTDGGWAVIEFWDLNGVKIEDVSVPVPIEPRIIAVFLSPPVTIPPSGYVTARVDSTLSPNAKLIWHSAVGTTAGSNDPNKLFVNDQPNSANFLSPNLGVLTFELVGEEVAVPFGACCETDGSCNDKTPWECEAGGGQFRGVGNVCPAALAISGRAATQAGPAPWSPRWIAPARFWARAAIASRTVAPSRPMRWPTATPAMPIRGTTATAPTESASPGPMTRPTPCRM